MKHQRQDYESVSSQNKKNTLRLFFDSSKESPEIICSG